MAAKVRHHEPRPFDRTLAFFDPILPLTALVVEGDDALGRPRQVGYDEPYARVKLTRMPLDLGHYRWSSRTRTRR